MVTSIFKDIEIVLSWLIKNQSDRLLEKEIVLFGRSMGGAIILTHGFKDIRASKLIALCTRYDYHTTDVKFSEDVIKEISPKYFLKNDERNNNRILIAHCKDDNRIPFKNVYEIKKHLSLDDKNVLIYDNGGHSFKGHREDLLKYCIEFIKKR